jgi:starvation-inducible DNA-binding protein
MNMLSDNLKTLLATSYAFVIKTQNFHWNVEGPDFPQYHKFLGKLYEEVYDNAIDKTAELIRQLDSYTPGSITRFAELSQISDQTKIPRGELMMAELYEDNQKILELWKQAFHVAEQEDQQGIADFIASRIDAHGKHGWMLRSILNKARA